MMKQLLGVFSAEKSTHLAAAAAAAGCVDATCLIRVVSRLIGGESVVQAAMSVRPSRNCRRQILRAKRRLNS